MSLFGLILFLSFLFPSGGLELLFNRQKAHRFSFPVTNETPASAYTMRYLIDYLKVNVCTERQELFVAEDSVSAETERKKWLDDR